VIFVSDLPCLTTAAVAQVILFIHFIDVMYDRGIQVYLSAAVPVEALYEQGEMQATFKRTLSRLIEMQAVDYLSRHPHRKLEYISHCGIAMPHDTFQTT
jgi:cell division protein ZapE